MEHEHTDILTSTDLPLPGKRAGKVRDVYDIPPAGPHEPRRTLLVATDRLSAFDVVLPTPIPGKGILLTALSMGWFELIRTWNIIEDHVISTRAEDVPGLGAEHRRLITGRCMIGRSCRVIPIECVARGYLEGSGWHDYQQTGSVCGVPLPRGLRRGEALPEPIFTPATKAERGQHDENISYARACELVGEPMMRRLRDATMAIYDRAHAHARQRGVILADTKFEFGVPSDQAAPLADGSATADWSAMADRVILIDEALTPDSSRYWPAESWSPGHAQQSFDKQFVREHLQALVDAGAWDKSPPGPELPEPVVRGTLERYQQARERLFGRQ
ncbi:MAG: phosphoribosylaminoimidazolesuccinocarboxamide synthase [Phycisphaerales bacterium]